MEGIVIERFSLLAKHHTNKKGGRKAALFYHDP
jgi:hypothetical protein